MNICTFFTLFIFHLPVLLGFPTYLLLLPPLSASSSCRLTNYISLRGSSFDVAFFQVKAKSILVSPILFAVLLGSGINAESSTLSPYGS